MPSGPVSPTLCQCMLVSEQEVLATIRSGARTVDEVGERCDAGTGCGSCRGGIELLIQHVVRQEVRRQTRETLPEAMVAQLGLFDRLPKASVPVGAHGAGAGAGAAPAEQGRGRSPRGRR
jgi:bacterioferritin-associated ferredoxin